MCVCIRVLYWNACYLKNIHISLIVFYFCQIWFKYPTFVILTNLLFTDNYISLNTLFLFHLNINFYLPKYNYFSPSFCNLTRVVHRLVRVDFGLNLTKLGGKLEGPLLTERMNRLDRVELATGRVSKDLLRSRWIGWDLLKSGGVLIESAEITPDIQVWLQVTHAFEKIRVIIDGGEEIGAEEVGIIGRVGFFGFSACQTKNRTDLVSFHH